MTCCSNCFAAESLVRVIEAEGTRAHEPCAYCNSDSGLVVDLEALTERVARVVNDHYMPATELSGCLDAFEEGSMLGDLVQEDFDLFSDAASNKMNDLLFAVLNAGVSRHEEGYDRYTLWARRTQDVVHWSHDDYWAVFASAAGRLGPGILAKRARIGGDERSAIGVLRQAAEDVEITLAKGTPVWRARIGNGFSLDAVGAPAAKFSTAGRGNAQGDPVFYAATKRRTAIFEVRPAIGDTVTTLRFKTRRPLRICDLTRRFETCEAFVETDEQYAQYKSIASRNGIRSRIGRYFSVPVRRDDGPNAYLATQVFATMVRRLGFDGIAYSSSQRPRGQNLLIFDAAQLKPSGVLREFDVGGVSYSYRQRHRRAYDAAGCS